MSPMLRPCCLHLDNSVPRKMLPLVPSVVQAHALFWSTLLVSVALKPSVTGAYVTPRACVHTMEWQVECCLAVFRVSLGYLQRMIPPAVRVCSNCNAYGHHTL